jgi:pyridoxamine 5'-phosphate oxidase
MNINQDMCPLELFNTWFQDAQLNSEMKYANAFVLATTDNKGHPDARVVLAKSIDVKHGFLVFYTNYESSKALQIMENSRASSVFYWDKMKRQVRISGLCIQSPDNESDDYFARRPLENQINATVSQQSQIIDDYATLVSQYTKMLSKYQNTAFSSLKRPKHWGGFRLYFSSLEFWIAGSSRFHQRYKFNREINQLSLSSISKNSWKMSKLQP